ncbi:hypothetical protein ISF_04134 [Cordyceps fumosorosea ARSEF 2679]|uniref:Involucrin repeat protein n=1 Tax=Cordyceps fumosorosea (strain ARSEF 2679) TaxID=1081104 RepID=A0A167YGH7_CORFA|nr:hypothetical protein ISF_04134 [Cordyceps fumosorosea ARSEF 2679]OAA66296.1 hypothetical protein ISF_04134 [Cordyceps fumosorosea ARSEF 2679]
MSASDKRRAHGVTGNHVLRTATSVRHAHHSSGSSAGAPSPSSTHSVSGAGSHLPAVPQRVAVVNPSSVSDDTHETSEKDKEKDKEKDGTGASSSSGGMTPRTSSSSSAAAAARAAKDKQRERESASLAAQVRHKDERIAHLERELDTMEREFQHQLDKLSASESETATFWQAKHSALHQRHLRADTELRLLRAEVDVREAERAELRQGWEALRRELQGRDEEVRALRMQVRGLKEFVSTSTRADGQASDEVFGDGMARLGNGLQNWVISHFRRAKLDLSTLDDETTEEISNLIPMYEELATTAKVHLLQSVVSRILVDMVFDAYFVGLSDDQTRQLCQMEETLGELCGDSGSGESVNRWRAATLSLLRREGSPALLRDGATAVAEAVVAQTSRILDRLTGGSSGGGGRESRDVTLRALVNDAIELARLLVVQKAVLRVCMPRVLPHERVFFDASTMEDIGGGAEEEEEYDDGEGQGMRRRREVRCVVFPGVVKRGDEEGAQMQYRNVLCKAKVVCRQD